ncbi:1,2-dihydroxy-3-keto-5-methylthiopentene dioxygenase [Rhodotorula toruloides]|nr:1,2-dihydroxy-3-keto-5-methylthiopentene dioxygenase [Rhodotorula toruloides]
MVEDLVTDPDLRLEMSAPLHVVNGGRDARISGKPGCKRTGRGDSSRKLRSGSSSVSGKPSTLRRQARSFQPSQGAVVAELCPPKRAERMKRWRSEDRTWRLAETMKAYIYDDKPGDQREPHDSGEEVSVDQLKAIGVLPYPGIELDQVEEIAKSRGYKNRDEINVSKAGLGDVYEEKIKGFFREHLHEDEEIRYIKDGRGYFDIREAGDKRWIRIAVEPKDLLIVPAGVYHRFTLDSGDYIKAMRLFQDEPKWIPHDKNEATDKNPTSSPSRLEVTPLPLCNVYQYLYMLSRGVILLVDLPKQLALRALAFHLIHEGAYLLLSRFSSRGTLSPARRSFHFAALLRTRLRRVQYNKHAPLLVLGLPLLFPRKRPSSLVPPPALLVAFLPLAPSHPPSAHSTCQHSQRILLSAHRPRQTPTMQLLSTTLAALTVLASVASANPYIYKPVAASHYKAGDSFTVSWRDNGEAPLSSTYGTTDIMLYTGSALQQVQLAKLGSIADPSKVTEQRITIDPSWGPDSDQYFIRIQSQSAQDASGAPLQAFSARFQLTQMTGQWSSSVKAALASNSTVAATSAASAGSAATTSRRVAGSAVSTSSSASASTGSSSSMSGSASASAASASKSATSGAGKVAVGAAVGVVGVVALALAA